MTQVDSTPSYFDARNLPPARVRTRSAVTDDFFEPQPTPTAELPDPEPLIANLARNVIEILAGARDLNQVARWVTDEVYSKLLWQSLLAQRARTFKKQPVRRPTVITGRVILGSPRDGIVDAVVVTRNGDRVRAVAIRLEGLDRRWRASVIAVL